MVVSPPSSTESVPIWESAAITIYLGETFGVAEDGDSDTDDGSLYPTLGPKRGEAMKWIVWTNTTLAAAGGKLAASLPVGTPGGVEEGSQDAATSGVESKGEQAKEREAGD